MTPGATKARRRASDHLQVYALVLLPPGMTLRQVNLPEGTEVAAMRLTRNTFAVVPGACEQLAAQLARYLQARVA